VQARIVTLVLVVTTAVAAARDREPIALVTADAAFASALDDALVPAEIVSIGAQPAPSAAELTTRSRELADGEHATATVWLLPAPHGAMLVAYDRSVDRLLVRELPYRLPLSAAQAAEAARMARTMLRALRVAAESDAGPEPVVVPTSPPQPMIGASVGVGAWFAAPGNDSALAGSLAIGWRPHGLGAAVTATLAPRADIVTMTFAGTVRDVVIGAEARRALLLPPSLRITPAAGVAMHLVTLTGSFGGGSPLTSRRYNPALRVGVSTGYALPRGIEVGVAVAADYLMTRQRYEAASEEILVVPRLQVVTGVLVGLRL
jgi:hypothetical protein